MEGRRNRVGPFGDSFAFSMSGRCLKLALYHVGLFGILRGPLNEPSDLDPFELVRCFSLLFGHLHFLPPPPPRSRCSLRLSLCAINLAGLPAAGMNTPHILPACHSSVSASPCLALGALSKAEGDP